MVKLDNIFISLIKLYLNKLQRGYKALNPDWAISSNSCHSTQQNSTAIIIASANLVKMPKQVIINDRLITYFPAIWYKPTRN